MASAVHTKYYKCPLWTSVSESCMPSIGWRRVKNSSAWDRHNNNNNDTYSDEWIHIYTDGSAFKGTMNAGYGSRIQYPDHSTDELFNPCGIHCSNFEAEAIAIEASLHHLSNIFTLDVERQNNVVIFSDAKSVLQALEHGKSDNLTTKSLANTIDNFLSAHTVELTLQWIPGHVNIPGNECADRLAKKGSTCPQINTPASMNTARHIIKNNKREEWMNEWAGGSKGRSIFNHMTRPNPNDHLNLLERKQQAVIFRLRSQHAPNMRTYTESSPKWISHRAPSANIQVKQCSTTSSTAPPWRTSEPDFSQQIQTWKTPYTPTVISSSKPICTTSWHWVEGHRPNRQLDR